MTYADDFVAIQQLTLAYSFAASGKNAAAIADTFAEDGILVGLAAMVGRAETETVGRAAIRELFESFLPGIELLHQMAQTGNLRISGNTAEAEAMILEKARWTGQPVSLFAGRYLDKYVRTSEGWRFAKRTLVPRSLLQIDGTTTVF